MAKYLIITKEGDFISNSRNIKTHTLNSNGSGVMIYDKNGILINSSTKSEDGNITIHGNKFYDGEPRQWAASFIKDNVIGIIVDDAKEFVLRNKTLV